ncbi:hypothetical protein J6590_053877 [Homalodisca vitripennis]|nr:hypothetical protein J6590_053877 [Homalodisca vitripennis]
MKQPQYLRESLLFTDEVSERRARQEGEIFTLSETSNDNTDSSFPQFSVQEDVIAAWLKLNLEKHKVETIRLSNKHQCNAMSPDDGSSLVLGPLQFGLNLRARCVNTPGEALSITPLRLTQHSTTLGRGALNHSPPTYPTLGEALSITPLRLTQHTATLGRGALNHSLHQGAQSLPPTYPTHGYTRERQALSITPLRLTQHTATLGRGALTHSPPTLDYTRERRRGALNPPLRLTQHTATLGRGALTHSPPTYPTHGYTRERRSHSLLSDLPNTWLH